MRLIGVLLIIIGAIGIIWGGVTFVKDRDTAKIGPVDIAVEQKERVNIPPIIGVIALIAGGIIVGANSRRNPNLTT